MKTLLLIFLILFVIIILYLIYIIAKLEIKREEYNRQALEAENSEFEYGHNVKNYKEERI